MENTKYKFRWSTSTIIFTTLYSIGIILLLAATYPYNTWWVICINVFVMAITLYFVAIAPRCWVITNDGLRLTRVFSPSLLFSFEEYTIKSTTMSRTSNALRVFGSGGFMGFIGLFYSKNLGFFSMYITDQKSDILVLSRKRDGKAVVMNGSYQIICGRNS